MRGRKGDMKSEKFFSQFGVVVIFLFMLTTMGSSQEQKSDSSIHEMRNSRLESLSVGRPSFYLRSLWFFSQPTDFQSPFVFDGMKEKIDLIAPWKLEMENQEKFQMMRTILESVELSGASYIAYEHIKKYGLK